MEDLETSSVREKVHLALYIAINFKNKTTTGSAKNGLHTGMFLLSRWNIEDK